MRRMVAVLGVVLMSVAVATADDAVSQGSVTTNAEPGFRALFDGRSLEGWVGDTDGYTVEDGVIACVATKGGNIFYKDEFADFVLRFEFRMPKGANNGLAIRTPLDGHASFDGIELQIIDNDPEKYPNLQPWQQHGSVYGVVAAKVGYLKPLGEWNEQEVTAQGRRVKVVLNGETIVDADLDEALADGTLDGKEHPGVKRTSGHIGFLGHGARVEFRNIRIQPLEASGQ